MQVGWDVDNLKVLFKDSKVCESCCLSSLLFTSDDCCWFLPKGAEWSSNNVNYAVDDIATITTWDGGFGWPTQTIYKCLIAHTSSLANKPPSSYWSITTKRGCNTNWELNLPYAGFGKTPAIIGLEFSGIIPTTTYGCSDGTHSYNCYYNGWPSDGNRVYNLVRTDVCTWICSNDSDFSVILYPSNNLGDFGISLSYKNSSGYGCPVFTSLSSGNALYHGNIIANGNHGCGGRDGTVKIHIGGGTITPWMINIDYSVGNIVFFNNNTYKCIQANYSVLGVNDPSFSSYWTQLEC